ncbi:hypothetical protein, partial [Xanthomonas vasicola]
MHTSHPCSGRDSHVLGYAGYQQQLRQQRKRLKDGLINATGKRSNRIRRAEGAQIADFLPVSARLRGVAWITG